VNKLQAVFTQQNGFDELGAPWRSYLTLNLWRLAG